MALKIETKYIDYKNNPWGYQETNSFDDICIHNTANSASADNEWAYMNKMQKNGHATVHYFVDETKAIKCMPYSVDAWAVSDGAGKGGNTTDIHIEICRSTSSDATYNRAFANAMELIAIICKELNWKPEGRIKFHYDYKTKYCPHKSLDNFGGNAEKLRAHVISEVNQKMQTTNQKQTWTLEKFTSKNGNKTHYTPYKIDSKHRFKVIGANTQTNAKKYKCPYMRYMKEAFLFEALVDTNCYSNKSCTKKSGKFLKGERFYGNYAGQIKR